METCRSLQLPHYFIRMIRNTETAKPHWGYRLLVSSLIAMVALFMGWIVMVIPRRDAIFFGAGMVLFSLTYLLRFRRLAFDAIELEKHTAAWTGKLWGNAGEAEAQRLFLGIGLAIFFAGCLSLAKPDWGWLEPHSWMLTSLK
jgi:hypothetical protein